MTSWKDLSPLLSKLGCSSLVPQRLNILKNILNWIKSESYDVDSICLDLISRDILNTFAIYEDSKSKQFVLQIFQEILKRQSNFLDSYIDFISNQILKKSGERALVDYLNLLNWIHLFFKHAATDRELFDKFAPKLTHLHTVISYNIESILDMNENERKPGYKRNQQRKRMRIHVFQSTTKMLVYCLQYDSEGHYVSVVADVLLSQYLKLKIPVIGVVIMIGSLVSSILQLLPSMPGHHSVFKEQYVDKYCEFLGKEIVLSKDSHSMICVNTFLSIFIKEFVDTELFVRYFVPNFEKSNLRSPEHSFNISNDFYCSIDSKKIDLVKIFTHSKLMPQSLSSFKSNKDSIRSASLHAIIALLRNIDKDNYSENEMADFVEEIFKNIKLNLNSEYKILSSKILQSIPPISEIVSNKIITALTSYISKESNDLTLYNMLNAFFIHLNAMSCLSESLLVIIKNGLREKRIPLKKVWFDSFLNNSITCKDFVISQFETDVFNYIKDVLSYPTKHNALYILGSMIYFNRISQLGLVSLQTKLENIIREIVESSSSFGYSWIYITLSTQLSPQQRLHSVQLLNLQFQKYPYLVGCSVVGALEEMLSSPLSSMEIITFKYATPLFNALSQCIDNKVVSRKILIDLIILAQVSDFHLKNGWAGLVINSKQNPDLLVANHACEIIKKATNIAQNKEYFGSLLSDAAFKAISYASFVNPNVMAPLVVDLLRCNLSIENLSKFEDEEILIWKGTDNELVVDVLANGSLKKLENKNSKDYETLKWEEGIRKQQKKVGMKKLSSEEQKLVAKQLHLEAQIRSNVSSVVSLINCAIGVISNLVEDMNQIDNGASIWYPEAVNLLLLSLQHPTFNKLMGDKGISIFLKLSSAISDSMGLMKRQIGVATLEFYSHSSMPEESLVNLISSILFKFRLRANEMPFDSISFSYILPLLIRVLEVGKNVAIQNSAKSTSHGEFIDEDKREENLLLAIDIISIHAELFEDSSMPRIDIISVLISLLRLSSKAKLAKECFMVLCHYIALSPTIHDLDVLFAGLISPNQFIRSTILEALDNEFKLYDMMSYSPEIFICTQDSDTSNRETAEFIWEFNKFEITSSLIEDLFKFFNQSDSGLRLFVAKSVAISIGYLSEQSEQTFRKYLQKLMDLYVEKACPPKPILDEYGLVAVSTSQQQDLWEERSTIAIIFKELIMFLPKSDEIVVEFVQFLVDSGALGDKNSLVRQEIKEAGIEIINKYGARNIESLVPIFEGSLSSNIELSIKENIVVLYGFLARHLKSNDVRVNTIIERLLISLDTPSEDVQQAVSTCLSSLVHLINMKVREYIDMLIVKLLDAANSDQIRRGAAWGISGLVNGYGIRALSEFDIIRNLTEASEDKHISKRRESVSYVFECLSKSLGKFFEPYVIEVLPIILKNLGDPVIDVRNATIEASKAIMAHTTSFGIKKLIPIAILNLDEIAWRTKRGSVELLGNMAYLDPTQLSASLSIIVPKIVSVLNDSHKEVRKAADQSLKRFGEVIRNPEIQKLVPILIQAIGDPTKYTENALDSLIKTQFVHYIDGPSLALIIHVIHRGMRERSANIKRKACKIVGNMAILVDSRDLIPYLPQLVQEVEIAMVDPVPNTRATAARALGALVERLGENQFPDLIPRLFSTLSDEKKSGDRLGSAQALAETISGLGLSKLDELLPDILAGVTNYRTYVREGFMPLLLFLPVCFGAQFAPYVSHIIQPILEGLADRDENIHDTALKAGKLIIKNYSNKAIDLLLPELEQGMFNENERIRLSSVQLSGDLLFQVTGLSSKNEFLDEDSQYSGVIGKQIIDILGKERYNRIFSALFICRSDTSGFVRSSAIDIWKALVPNTPRTIKEILPTLTSVIIIYLASSSNTLKSISAQALGDLVRRIGGNALFQLLPTLEELLTSADFDSRQGVCIALQELINSSNIESLFEFQSSIVNILRSTLIDKCKSVRKAAAFSFDAYQDITGETAIDEIIPYLLSMLESKENSEYALLALREIISKKSDVIFPILIPRLLSPPIDVFKARTLGSLSEVTGITLYKHLSNVINVLIGAIIDKNCDEECKEVITRSLDTILSSVSGEEGLHPLFQLIMSLMKSDNVEKRIIILNHLPKFFDSTSLNYSLYTPEIVSLCIMSLNDEDSRVTKGNFETLSSLLKRQDKNMLSQLIIPAKQALTLIGGDGECIRAFSLPKGPNCILPIFLHGLMYGSGDEREASAMAIADIVSKTAPADLKPFVTIITGPLIRVIGERFNSDIKAAILYALNVLFAKIPQLLKPFIPQLQRTFVKSLSDPSNEILRLRAAKALGTLIEYQPRVDPLVIELVTGARQAIDDGVKTTMLKALLEVVTKGGSKLNQVSKTAILNLAEDEILSADDKLVTAYARLIGSLSSILLPEESEKILTEKVLHNDLENSFSKFSILILNAFLKESPDHIFNPTYIDKFIDYLFKCTNSTHPYLTDNAIIAMGKLLILQGETVSPFIKVDYHKNFVIDEENLRKLMNCLTKCILQPGSNSLDSRRLSLVVVRTLARYRFDECIYPFFDELAPSIFSCLRDMVIPIKLAAEKAYIALFKLVDESDMKTFDHWINSLSSPTINNSIGTPIQLKSITDYTKRVAKRLATVERERIAAGGDIETIFSDRIEDEKEIWAVGGVDLDKEF